jgi:hypothetical protein
LFLVTFAFVPLALPACARLGDRDGDVCAGTVNPNWGGRTDSLNGVSTCPGHTYLPRIHVHLVTRHWYSLVTEPLGLATCIHSVPTMSTNAKTLRYVREFIKCKVVIMQARESSFKNLVKSKVDPIAE